MRRFVPIYLVYFLVLALVVFLVLRRPEWSRPYVYALPALYVLAYFLIRRMQKTRESEISVGKALPVAPAKMRTAMWLLALYGVASYISGASNVADLLHESRSELWLGWSIKMGIGTVCLWTAYKVHKSGKSRVSEARQQLP
jgi:hypothetical protein